MSRTAAPNRIIVAGDWHGNTSWALDVIGRAGELLAGEEHRVILHLGDFGIWPGHEGCDYICDVALALAQADAQLWFVDGNHEDHDQLRHDAGSELAIPVGPGLYGDTICWLPRGHRWEWHGRHMAGSWWCGVRGPGCPGPGKPGLVAGRRDHR